MSRCGADAKSAVSIMYFPALNMVLTVRCLWCGERRRSATTGGGITAIGALKPAL